MRRPFWLTDTLNGVVMYYTVLHGVIKNQRNEVSDVGECFGAQLVLAVAFRECQQVILYHQIGDFMKLLLAKFTKMIFQNAFVRVVGARLTYSLE